jgi:hypothetical protein
MEQAGLEQVEYFNLALGWLPCIAVSSSDWNA